METYNLSKITFEHFESLSGKEIFIEFSEGQKTKAEVLAVTKTKSYSPLDRETFSVTFRTPGEKGFYEQRIYIIHHPDLQALPIFLVPVGADPAGMKYEAIFS